MSQCPDLPVPPHGALDENLKLSLETQQPKDLSAKERAVSMRYQEARRQT